MLGKMFGKVTKFFEIDPYDDVLRQMRNLEKQHGAEVENVASYQKLTKKCEQMERSKGLRYPASQL